MAGPNTNNERMFTQRHVIPIRNGELLILVYEDRRGDPYLVIKRIKKTCLLYTSPSPRDAHESRMPSSA